MVPIPASNLPDSTQMQNRGVVEHDVRAAVFAHDEGLHRSEATLLRKVDAVVIGNRARNAPDGRLRTHPLLPVNVQHHNLRPHHGKTFGRLQPNAPARPGNQHHFAVKRAFVFLNVHKSKVT